MKQLLLIGSSIFNNGAYLSHCTEALKKFLGHMEKDEIIAFVPYALNNWDAHTLRVKKYFDTIGYRIESVHRSSEAQSLLNYKKVKAVFVGGGNTFLLKDQFEAKKILASIYIGVKTGVFKYVGLGAGAIMPCPTIKTTNDMPIICPSSFESLGLIDYQINPHFVSDKLIPVYAGERRETRIREFHEHCNTPVVGLPEGGWITVNGDESILCGTENAVIFRPNRNNTLWLPGEPFKSEG